LFTTSHDDRQEGWPAPLTGPRPPPAIAQSSVTKLKQKQLVRRDLESSFESQKPALLTEIPVVMQGLRRGDRTGINELIQVFNR
jgi:hypothetical protein